MPMRADELFVTAEKVENGLANLYKIIASHMTDESVEEAFFLKLSGEERLHAVEPRNLHQQIQSYFEFADLDPSVFNVMLETIDDVIDEISEQPIDVTGSLEIVLHMEQSAAEKFYQRFPATIPGANPDLVKRLVESCERHAEEVQLYLEHCRETGQAGHHA